jgi:hypothetical protein
MSRLYGPSQYLANTRGDLDGRSVVGAKFFSFFSYWWRWRRRRRLQISAAAAVLIRRCRFLGYIFDIFLVHARQALRICLLSNMARGPLYV